MIRLTRRAALGGAALLPLSLAASARAQGKFPDKPIRLIIPWAAGGPADAGFRILAESAAKKLGQPVVVENKGGAAGVLGALALQDAKPDGYTISQMHMSVLRQPMVNASLKYDPIRDLTYILQITGFVMGVVVRPDAPWKTLPELLAYAKANPGKLNWGTLGAGSTQHLAMESLGLEQGLTWTHAPYRGTADTLRALMGGEIEVDDAPDGGAAFRVAFMAPACCLVDDSEAEVEAGGLDEARPLRVLAAEDNAGNRHVLRALLGPLPVALTLVEDGQQAVAALAAQPFDMVLMDANMPVMDGLAALREIRASGSAIPVWMLTANVYDEDVARYRAAGADGVVRKPIALEELFAALSEAAARVDTPVSAEAA